MALATAHRTATPRRTRRGTDSYDGIEPWLEKLSAMDDSDPGRPQLREAIVRRCLPLAEHIARRFVGRGENYEDLYQIASVGLVLAVDRFDPARGPSFLSFAVPTIMGEVRRHFRDTAGPCGCHAGSRRSSCPSVRPWRSSPSACNGCPPPSRSPWS